MHPWQFVISALLLFILGALIVWTLVRSILKYREGNQSGIGIFLQSFGSTILSRSIHLILISLFLFVVIGISIVPVDFVAYNEDDTKYSYGIYLSSLDKNPINWGLQGTNQGGVYAYEPFIYRLFGISGFFDALILYKWMMAIALIISFFLVRDAFMQINRLIWPKLVSDQLSKRYLLLGYVGTLMAMLYVSMPQIGYYLWHLKSYYMFQHLFSIIGLVCLLHYFSDGRNVMLIAGLASMWISYLSHGEFAFLMFVMFCYHFMIAVKSIRKNKVRIGLLIHSLSTLLLVYSLISFFFVYFDGSSQVRPAFAGLRSLPFYLSWMQESMLGVLWPLSGILFIIVPVLLFILLPKSRPHILLCIAAVFVMNLPIMLVDRYLGYMYAYYHVLFMLIPLSILCGWLIVGGKGVWRPIMVVFSLLLIISIALSATIVMPSGPLFSINLPNEYNRQIALENSQFAHEAYDTLLLTDKPLIIYDKYGGELYLKYIYMDKTPGGQPIEFRDFSMLNSDYVKAHDDFNSKKQIMVFLSHSGATCEKIRFKSYLTQEFNDLGLNHTSLDDAQSFVTHSNLSTYISWGNNRICLID